MSYAVLFFQEVNDLVTLPQMARWALTIAVCIVAIISAIWQFRINKLYKDERDVYKARAERLKEEGEVLKVNKIELEKENAVLKERTDLTSFMERLQNSTEQNCIEHAAIVETLKDINGNIIEQTRILANLNK